IISLCIKSILMRTNVLVEIVVFDSSSDYVDDPFLEDLNACGIITLIKEHTLISHAEALNRMLPLVTTPYILVLDSDSEIMNQNWLKQILSTAKKNDASIVHLPLRFVKPEKIAGGIYTQAHNKKCQSAAAYLEQ